MCNILKYLSHHRNIPVKAELLQNENGGFVTAVYEGLSLQKREHLRLIGKFCKCWDAKKSRYNKLDHELLAKYQEGWYLVYGRIGTVD